MVLLDFSLALAIVITSLNNYISENKMSELDMLDIQGGGDAAELSQDDQSAENDASLDHLILSPDVAVAQQQLQSSTQKKKKAKVLETWNDAPSSDEEELAGPTEVGTPAESDTDTWVEDGRGGLKNVHLAFKMLKVTFDTKFRAMWA